IPSDEPIGGLAVGLGDILAPLRAILGFGALAGKSAFTADKILFTQLAETTQFGKEITDMVVELEKYDIEKNFALLQPLTELQSALQNDNTRRIEIFKKEQALDQLSQQYRSTLAKGFRLIQERVAYNKKVAAITQENRYQDMTLRVSRNTAMAKY